MAPNTFCINMCRTEGAASKTCSSACHLWSPLLVVQLRHEQLFNNLFRLRTMTTWKNFAHYRSFVLGILWWPVIYRTKSHMICPCHDVTTSPNVTNCYGMYGMFRFQSLQITEFFIQFITLKRWRVGDVPKPGIRVEKLSEHRFGFLISS